jgi:hypothetical protein
MPDFPNAIGQDMLQEPAEKLHAVEVGGAWAGAAHLTGGEGDRAVRERDHAAIGDGDPEDRGGEGGAGGVAVVMGRTVDVPRDGPDLGGDVLQQSGLAHVCFAQSAGDGGEGGDGDKEGGAGGQPRCAVGGETTARDDGVDVGVGLELPAPGVQDPGAPRESSPDAALVCGQPLESRCRRLHDACNIAWYARR